MAFTNVPKRSPTACQSTANRSQYRGNRGSALSAPTLRADRCFARSLQESLQLQIMQLPEQTNYKDIALALIQKI